MKMFVVLLFLATNSYANQPSQTEVRSLFQKAVIEENSCRYLIKMLDSYNENNNSILAGYKACATMILAKYAFNPFAKLSTFLKGRILLEKCIALNKQNLELRFLRFTIQSKAPFFLGYRSSLKEDGSILINSAVNLKDTNFKQMIAAFLTTEGYLK